MRDEVRAGNLAIDGAKNFGRFDSFFLPERQWQQSSGAFWARTGFPADPDPAAQQLKTRFRDHAVARARHLRGTGRRNLPRTAPMTRSTPLKESSQDADHEIGIGFGSYRAWSVASSAGMDAAA